MAEPNTDPLFDSHADCGSGIVLPCTLPFGHDGWHFHEDDDGRLWRWPPSENTGDDDTE